jgi:hypothetical protein
MQSHYSFNVQGKPIQPIKNSLEYGHIFIDIELIKLNKTKLKMLTGMEIERQLLKY